MARPGTAGYCSRTHHRWDLGRSRVGTRAPLFGRSKEGHARRLGVAGHSYSSVYAGTTAQARIVGPFAAPLADRYYFELMPILVLFVATVLAEIHPLPKRRSGNARLRAGRAPCSGGWSCLLSANSSRSVERLFAARYGDGPNARLFLRTCAGLKRVSRDPDGTLPWSTGTSPATRGRWRHPKKSPARAWANIPGRYPPDQERTGLPRGVSSVCDGKRYPGGRDDRFS